MKKREISIQNSNKDILAKLMATENITVLHKKVPTAYFDVKNRTLVCPMLKDDMSSEMYDLFMGHEVGHALNTPVEGWHQSVSELGPVFKGYLNVIEDVRIEKEIKAKYPGLRRSFYKGYKELNNDNFFGLDGKDISKLNLIDKLNIHFKVGHFSRVDFTDEEKAIVKRCEDLKTFEQVMALAKELFEKQKEENKDKMESMTQDELQALMEELGIEQQESEDGDYESFGEEGEEGEEGEASFDSPVDSDEGEVEDEKKASSSGEGDNEEEDDEEGTGETDSSDADNESDEQSESPEPSGEQGGKSPEERLEDELNKSQTDEEFRSREEELHDGSTWINEPTYYELADKIKYQNFLVSWKESDRLLEENNLDRTNTHRYTKKFIDNNKKVINYMVKEFEMKKAAADYKRSQSAKTGEINMDKLHLYKLKDDIFNRIQVVPDGKNHGMIMIIDWSGSMHGSVKPTIEQAALLSMFCRRIQIPFRLYAFSDVYRDQADDDSRQLLNDDLHKSGNSQKKREQATDNYQDRLIIKTFGKNPFEKGDQNSWHLQGLSLLEIFNEKQSNAEFTRSMENWFEIAEHIEYGGYYNSSKCDADFRLPHGLNLGGTPLDHSIVLMRDYLKDFKKHYGLDITTFIALTDGSSHSCFGRSNTHLVDRKFNKVHRLAGRATHGLLRWLKETTGVRTIGFFLTKPNGRRFFYDAEAFTGTDIPSWEDYGIEKKKEFMKLAATFEGGAYDLSILINQKKLELNYNEDELNVDVGANKGQLKRALVKAGNNKMKQRVILNKFVQQMAV